MERRLAALEARSSASASASGPRQPAGPPPAHLKGLGGKGGDKGHGGEGGDKGCGHKGGDNK
eukprot:6768997-Alexandrium_andersonii.AAC.1